MRVALLLVACGCQKLLDLQEVPQPPTPPPPPPPSSWQSVSMGEVHACGIHQDQSLWCWGRNDNGELGAAEPGRESDTPVQVGTASWLQVSASFGFTCGIQSDGSLWCWGQNTSGQLGTGETTPSAVPLQIRGTWTAVQASALATYALDDAGALWAWGDEQSGELGDGSSEMGTITGPHMVARGPWTSIAAGLFYACALDTSGEVSCWGDDAYGEIGLPAATTVPMRISEAGPYTAVSSGGRETCVLRADGRLRCFGADDFGQLGDDSTISTATPVAVGADMITDWTDISVAFDHACARRSNGSLYCWGSNSYGALASDTSPYAFRGTPVQVTGGGSSWLAVGAGYLATCAIDSDHDLWCAGHAAYGELSAPGSVTQPAPVAGAWTIASAGETSTCGLDANRRVQCWGDNGGGQLGNATYLPEQTPISADGVANGVAVGDQACDIDSATHMRCWGNSVLAPAQIGVGTWARVAVSHHTCGVDFSGQIWCWGVNNDGECGTTAASSIDSASPNQVTGFWSEVATGLAHSCGISGDHTQVYCWGNNNFGQLGDDTTTASPAPVVAMTPTGRTWDRVVAGQYHTCARAGTELWCWGYGGEGELGNQTTDTLHTPIQVPGTWLDVAAGGYYVCAIDTSHALYCWGSNVWGQLGGGTFLDHHEPTRVGTDSDWQTITAGVEHTCGTRSGNTLYCWGRNDHGEDGDGTAWTTMFQKVP